MNLAEVTSTGFFYIQPKSAAVAQVQASCARALAEGTLSTSQASKLRGQTTWTASLTVGKLGRMGIQVLKEHQSGERLALTDADRIGLSFLSRLVAALPPKCIQVVLPPPPPAVLYTDASFEPESHSLPRGGWVLFQHGAQGAGRAIEIPEAVVASWKDRATQITPAEAWTVFAALAEHAVELSCSDLIVFVDNEAAASSIIRGDSTQRDLAEIAQGIHWLSARHQIRLWVEWIDSESNPSDGLSRDGLSDSWTAQQGWQLAAAQVPPDLSVVSLQGMIRKTLGFDV